MLRRMADRPHREIRDPRALRAIAHPVRIRLLEELLAGSATATELAERVGESPANCSWHLRQLARYGYVEEAGGGSGRQRPWRLVVESKTWGEDGSPEAAIAGDAAAEMLLDREYEVMRGWFAGRRSDAPEWRRAGFVNISQLWLTADELAAMSDEIGEILTRHFDRLADESLRPDGARLVRFVAWGAPAGPRRSPEPPPIPGPSRLRGPAHAPGES
jgi:DNA-binding transcriptional ArsR family regulator